MEFNSTDFNSRLYTCQTGLRKFAMSFTKNDDDADDLVQDTLLKAMRYAEKFKEGTNLKGWLHTIMKNTFINKYRKNVRVRDFQTLSTPQTSEQIITRSACNEGENKCMREDIQKAMAKLDSNYYIPFIRYFEGYKYHEIAEDLKLPIGTVKTRIHNARIVLRKNLKMYQEEFEQLSKK